MVKTTINLDTQVYRELVKEAVERYGTTKTLSKLINEKLREALGKKKNKDILERSFGIWKGKEDSVTYQRRIRKEWDRKVW
jgi:predicted CopG family antitoxin